MLASIYLQSHYRKLRKKVGKMIQSELVSDSKTRDSRKINLYNYSRKVFQLISVAFSSFGVDLLVNRYGIL